MEYRTFAAVLVLLGVVLVGGVSFLSAEGGWDWWFTPALAVGLVLVLAGLAEGVSS